VWGFILRGVANAIGFSLANPSNIANTNIRDATVGLYAALQTLANFLQALFGDEMTAWRKAGPNVVAGGKGIGDLAYHELYAWERLLRTILPGSLRWMTFSMHKYVDPKFGRVWKFLRVLDNRTKSLDKWRAHYVNPTLREWTRFRRFYFTWPNDTIRTVHNWLLQPWRFARWATPVLVPSFLAWLTPPHHKSQRDDLARILLQSAPDMPDQIGHVVLTILEGPVLR
jgi:hypothetical protein